MRFLFINPKRQIERKNIWSFVNSITPPLGLAVLAAILEENGHQADIVDAGALNMNISDILSKIVPEIDVVGITATTPEIENAINITRQIRNNFPEVKILMGGVHPTIFHKALVEDRICDMVIRGEAEEAILLFAQQKPLATIPNLTWRAENGEVIINPESSNYSDLDKIPFPAYHKLPMKRYHSALGAAKRMPSIGMITSRGCPGKCTFCYSGMFGSKIRFMSPARVIENIKVLKSVYGIKEISFYDDTFTAHQQRIKDVCNLLISEKVNISWSCFARVDSVSPELLKLMKKAGCHQVMYGFESVDESILKAIKKRTSVLKISNAITWTKDAGIDIRGAFMLGSPEDTESSIRKTIDFSKKAGIKFAVFNIMTPFPGTTIFDWATENGFLMHKNWSLYDLVHPVLELPSISSDTIQKYYYKAYREFYIRPGYILKQLLSVQNLFMLFTYARALGGILSLLKTTSQDPNK